MKFYNGEIMTISEFLLNELELAGKKNRMRMKFLNILAEKYKEFKQYHWQLLKEHCKLDEQGNPKTKKENGQNVYDIIDEDKFKKEYSELVYEEVVIEENEENKKMLLTIRDAIINCPNAYKGEKALVFDRIYEIFENIYQEDKETLETLKEKEE
jgi:hypothetical protein